MKILFGKKGSPCWEHVDLGGLCCHLRLERHLDPWTQPRALSGSMALQWQGSGVIPMTPVTTEGSTDAQGLVSHLRACWYLRAMFPLGPY